MADLRPISVPLSVRAEIARYAIPHLALSVGCAESTLADSTTYYFGCHYAKSALSTADTTRVYVPIAGQIRAAYLTWRASTAGTGEDVSAYIRVNNSSDTLIQTVGNTAQSKQFINASMTTAVYVGDYIEIKLVCPSWGTNPATVAIGGVVYIVGA